MLPIRYATKSGPRWGDAVHRRLTQILTAFQNPAASNHKPWLRLIKEICDILGEFVGLCSVRVQL